MYDLAHVFVCLFTCLYVFYFDLALYINLSKGQSRLFRLANINKIVDIAMEDNL